MTTEGPKTEIEVSTSRIRKTMEDKMNKRTLLLSMTLLAAMAWTNLPSSPAYAGDEALIVTAKLHATAGREAEYEARLVRFTEFVRKSEPGVTFRILHSNVDRTLFSTFEVYPNDKAFNIHVNVVIPAFGREAGLEPEGLEARPMEVEY